MVHISGTIGPLKSARQRRRRVVFVKPFFWYRIMFEIGRQCFKPGRNQIPIVESALQCRNDVGGIGIPGQIVGNDNQMAVATGFERCEFHLFPFTI